MQQTTRTHRGMREYAFCGTQEVFNRFLEELSELAEQEIWTYREDDPLHILRHYIYDTFDKCYSDNKILSSDTHSCFNTGLLTTNGEDIVALFIRNPRPDAQEWYLKGYYEVSSWEFLNVFNETPQLVYYHENYEDYYFNTNFRISMNLHHILRENKQRLVETLGEEDDGTLSIMLRGAWELTQARILRNMRIVIPQYYNNKISYLIPIIFNIHSQEITMALAVEKLHNDQYRANTIFTLEMAYAQARLLMKPEADWIIKK